jgi:DNA-directed RNA polymerase subunit RPC12/RpoP
MVCRNCGKQATRSEAQAGKCTRCGNRTFRLTNDPRVRPPAPDRESRPL